jgi:predicted peptidase
MDHGVDGPVSLLHGVVRAGGRALAVSVHRPRGWSAERRWAGLLFLHGRGECGANGAKHLTVGLGPALAERPRDWPFVALLPQKPDADRDWEEFEDLLLALLAGAERVHGVDPARVALTGLSQGGHGVWELARRSPGRFAALAPICGYPAAPGRAWRQFDPARDWSTERARPAAQAIAAAIGSVPVWAFHGDADAAVPVALTDVVIDALRQRGAEPRYTRLPGVGHDAWTHAYQRSGLAAWLAERLGAR